MPRDADSYSPIDLLGLDDIYDARRSKLSKELKARAGPVVPPF
jgi:hypothetical protein